MVITLDSYPDFFLDCHCNRLLIVVGGRSLSDLTPCRVFRELPLKNRIRQSEIRVNSQKKVVVVLRHSNPQYLLTSFFILSPGLKIGHTPRKNRLYGRNLPLHRISVAVTLDYYSRQTLKKQALSKRFFQIFCGFFRFFQFAPYLVLSPARHTTDEAESGTARPPRFSFYRTLSMHLQTLRAGDPSFPPAHARLQRTRTAYPAHRP